MNNSLHYKLKPKISETGVVSVGILKMNKRADSVQKNELESWGTFAFLDFRNIHKENKFLQEALTLFKDNYMHFGGDEVDHDMQSCWWVIRASGAYECW